MLCLLHGHGRIVTSAAVRSRHGAVTVPGRTMRPARTAAAKQRRPRAGRRYDGGVSAHGETQNHGARRVRRGSHPRPGGLWSRGQSQRARPFDRALVRVGPAYSPLVVAGNAKTYPGPYKDRQKNEFGLTAVQTPNPTPIVFHLVKPFADFNFVAAIPQSAPVPPSKDTGANYQLHPMSTGPDKFHTDQPN